MMTLVYAQDARGGIGYQNQLPWHLPNDLKFFKATTMGHAMVMGRKTFESMGRRLLPGRTTYVLTRQADYGQDIPGLHVLTSLDQVEALAQTEDLMVIGGAELFAVCRPLAQRVIRTVIDAEFPADTFVPPLDPETWQRVRLEAGQQDDRNLYAHQFEWWERRKEDDQ